MIVSFSSLYECRWLILDIALLRANTKYTEQGNLFNVAFEFNLVFLFSFLEIRQWHAVSEDHLLFVE